MNNKIKAFPIIALLFSLNVSCGFLDTQDTTGRLGRLNAQYTETFEVEKDIIALSATDGILTGLQPEIYISSISNGATITFTWEGTGTPDLETTIFESENNAWLGLTEFQEVLENRFQAVILVDRSELDSGTYSTELEVRTDYNVLRIPISAEVGMSQMELDLEDINFGSTDISKIINVSNGRQGLLDWTTSTPAESWITITSTDNGNGGTIQVDVDRSTLPPGFFSTSFEVYSDGGNTTIDIDLEVPTP